MRICREILLFADFGRRNGSAAGDRLAAATMGDMCRLGLTICYDIRFPELYSPLCAPSELEGLAAEVVLVPAAFTVPTGQAHWELLLRARAVENQVYVVAAAQSGKHNDKRTSYGHTMIVDPWGNVGKRSIRSMTVVA